MNFMNLGPMEMVIIGVIALVVVGPKKLPELGRMVGKWMKVVREASDEMRRGLYYEDSYRPPTKPRPTPAIGVSQEPSLEKVPSSSLSPADSPIPPSPGPGGNGSDGKPNEPLVGSDNGNSATEEPGTVKSAEYKDAYPYGQDGMD